MSGPYPQWFIESKREELEERDQAIAAAKEALGKRYDQIQTVAQRAFGHYRQEDVKSAVLAYLQKNSLDREALRLLSRAEALVRGLVCAALPFHGSAACAGANSASDVPAGIIDAIDEFLGE